MTEPKQSKYWCFTINNWSEEERVTCMKLDCSYMVFGEEVGEEGTPHLQGYVEFDSMKRTGQVCKLLGGRARVAGRKGTGKQASDYCKKGGDDACIYERGEMAISEQGKRVDLVEIRTKMQFEGLKVDNILMENPMMYHQYGRTLNAMEDKVLRGNWRKEMSKALWIHGGTGTGKSHYVFQNFHTDTHYVWPNDGKWWDGYRQQETVIFNDFRGEIAYNEILQIIDKWPYNVCRRNREPMPFTSKYVIITSSIPPEEVYKRRCKEDSIKQLMRRVKIVDMGTTEGAFRLCMWELLRKFA